MQNMPKFASIIDSDFIQISIIHDKYLKTYLYEVSLEKLTYCTTRC